MNYRIIVFVVLFISFSCKQQGDGIASSDNTLEVFNEKVKLILKKENNQVRQVFYAKKNTKWVEIAASFIAPKKIPKEATQLFNSSLDPEHRFMVNNQFYDFKIEKISEQKTVVKLIGRSNNVPITQNITLKKNKNNFHFEVAVILPSDKPKLDYALSSFTFNLDRAPFFVHTPGLKFDNEDSKQNRFKLLPGKDQVIGDRAFHAPAVILQEKGVFAALVPDLNAINKHKIVSSDARKAIDIGRNHFSAPFEVDKYTMPTGIDLNIETGLTEKPVMTFGYMDNIIAHHIHYQRVNNKSMVRGLESNIVKYEFDLFISADEKENQGFQQVTKFQWEKFGKPVFENRTHLAMPFSEYLRVVDSITMRKNTYKNIDTPLKGYKDTGSWLEWEMNGLEVGGYRSSINWWNDVLHNSAFWNNARDASGFWYWGKKLDRSDLIKKGRQIINFCLSAPQNKNGMFALLYAAKDKKWGLGFTDPINKKYQFFLKESDSYDVSIMSKTGAHLLDYYLRSEKDERIVNYLKPYGDWLLTVIDKRGAVPSYVDQKNMEHSPVLYYSAQPAASMWFLAELYNATKNSIYLKGANKIAKYLEKEVLPEQKWVDMEQFFSCGNRPFEFTRDRWQNQVARGNLALFWAIEGYGALYRATEDKSVLSIGEQCIDYVTFTQACWEPHFIYTAFPFGGFTVDNADNATFLDARQAEMVRSFIWYGKELGRQDLLERGVAAARASVVLMNHPRHKENNIYRHTNIYPFGLGQENIDHEAHPQSAMRTHPSWGEGSGVFTGLAEALRGLKSAYVNVEKKIYVGVDGVKIEKVENDTDGLHISMKSVLHKIKMDWSKNFTVYLKVEGVQFNKESNLLINGNLIGQFSKKEFENIKLTVLSDGKIIKGKK